ncbi:MAG: thiolase domain-containing protein [Chloroflexi bacterium]|nr:thiolase domain-containing protein [Chloroflexota bacterium]
MKDVYIIGLGQTEVGEHWETSLRHLAWEAIDAALKDARLKQPDALFVGNVLAGQLSKQEHLGVLVADFCGLRGIEAASVEAAGASGGMALRQAYLAVASGMVNTAIAAGVEKFTDTVGSRATAALTSATDSDWEAAQGATPAALAALIMRRYMHEFDCAVADFAGFSVNAHANAKTNPYAMFRNTITAEAFAKAPMVADPVNMFDTAPDADGAAAVIVAADDFVWAHRDASQRPMIRIAASAVATDSLALHDRPDPLFFRAANLSAGRAYKQAGIEPGDMNVLELHDAYTVYAALSLEACGFAPRGLGWRMAGEGGISLRGKMPLSTFGGLKARGNPAGATGIYQIVEAALQLRGEAGANQVAAPRWGMAQCLGGSGSTAVTHILERVGRDS